MCSISWKFALINNHRLTIDKGKGSCNGKRGERFYHIMDNLWYVMEHHINAWLMFWELKKVFKGMMLCYYIWY